mmetsp:Transcript_41705/g.82023  ORF Transcript_41705/g.82023 Transcript_41705/m.82023 type:complete len:600 (+) Transcript_41705:77-1876(+)
MSAFGTFPSKHSRVDLTDLLSRNSSDEDLRKAQSLSKKKAKEEQPVTIREQANYFVICFFYALGPSLLDIFLPRMCKETVKRTLRANGWNDSGNVFAYLYALTASAYPFTKCGSAPFMGYLSDQLGRRQTLTFTLVATGVMLFLTCRCNGLGSLLLCRSATGLFSNGGLLTAHASDIASSLRDRTTLFSYFITAWAFARVAAAYIYPLVGEDINVCGLCALVCELVAAVLTFSPSARGSSSLRTPSEQGEPQGGGRARVKARTILRNPLTFIRDRPSFRAAFREMMRDRLVALLFVTSLLMPKIDIAAYLWQKFKEGPSAVGYIKALESLTIILVPLTPAIRRLTGYFGHAGAAVLCAGLMALCWLMFMRVRTMNELYVVVLLRSAISTVYEPSIKSIIMDSARGRKREQVGSFAGLQQTMKGMSQVMGSFWGSFLASQDWSANTPLYLSALYCVANAAIIYHICCSPTSTRPPPSRSPSGTPGDYAASLNRLPQTPHQPAVGNSQPHLPPEESMAAQPTSDEQPRHRPQSSKSADADTPLIADALAKKERHAAQRDGGGPLAQGVEDATKECQEVVASSLGAIPTAPRVVARDTKKDI